MIRQDFKLYVECMTYNQHQYITDTMNGFVMQKTSFPYVCCIVDDASTDGENVIIDEYLKKWFDLESKEAFYHKETSYGLVSYAAHKTNKECYFLVILLKENHYQIGKDTLKLQYIKDLIGVPPYVATCEGDDYWIHPDKLQIQIDYLDKHPEYIISCHKCYIREELKDEVKTYLRPFDEDDGCYHGQDCFEYTFEDFFGGGKWINETAATIYRNVYNPYFWKNEKFRTRDVNMIFYLLKHGKGVCHNFIGSVYRWNNGSIFASLDKAHLAEIQNEIYTDMYSQTKEEILERPIIHCRFALLKAHRYNQTLDRFTIIAWKRYIVYQLNELVHAMVPNALRKIFRK